MLQQADQLCAGSRDMGSVVNVGGPLAIAIANEEFWKVATPFLYQFDRGGTGKTSVPWSAASFDTLLLILIHQWVLAAMQKMFPDLRVCVRAFAEYQAATRSPSAAGGI
jgi:hypothetical protein